MEIKVLALYHEENGSDFHRIVYPFKKVNGLELEGKTINVDLKKFEDVSLEEMEKYNILVYNWDVNLKIQDLGMLQAKGVKILYVLDDSYEIEESHPELGSPFMREYLKNRVKLHLLNANACIVTNERILLEAIKYNDNVAVIPNFINPADFKVLEKSKSDLLRVGIYGSGSHLNNFLSLKTIINKIAKNSQLVEKCEFVLAGYTDTPLWNEVLKMFKAKKKLKVRTLPYQNLDSYLYNYSEIDVLLCPLLYTNFNLSRSALKLLECSLTDTLPLGSSLYSMKELKGLAIADTPEVYVKSLETLLDKEYYNKALAYVKDVNLTDNNYQLRFENLSKVLYALDSEDLSVKLDNLEVHTITYDKNQVASYIPYDNSAVRTIEQKSYLFEYNPILNLSKDFQDDKYYGIFSWKFENKTGLTKQVLYKTLMQKKYQDFDVINLCRPIPEQYLAFSEKQHKGFRKLFDNVCNDLGLVSKEPNHVIYSNFFIAKGEVYKSFINDVVIPAIELLETKYKEDAWMNANYIVGLPQEKLKDITGLDYYTMHSFVLERLMSIYIDNKTLKTLNVF